MSPGRHGLALAGGGASGAYGVGVLRALFEGSAPSTNGHPLAPRVVAGTSVGAVNAVFLGARWTSPADAVDHVAEPLARFWLRSMAEDPCLGGALRPRANPAPLWRARCWLRRPRATLGRFASDLVYLLVDRLRHLGRAIGGERRARTDRLFDLADFGALLSVDDLVRALRAEVDFEALGRSSLPVLVTATGWDGEIHLFDNAQLDAEHGAERVRASCSIPGLMPVARVGGRSYVDGSMLLYAPVGPVLERGADVVHLVHMNTEVANQASAGGRGTNSTESLFRSLVMMWNTAIETEIERVRSHNALLLRLQRAGLDPIESRAWLREAGHPSAPRARFLTLHRYYPLGGFEGSFAFTNLGAERLARSIDAGYEETRNHDCRRCGCVLPPVAFDRPEGEGDDHDRDDP